MRTPLGRSLSIVAATCAALALPAATAAQASRPLHIIAPLAAGSTFDLLARAVGSRRTLCCSIHCFAPAGTPASTVARLHREFAAIAADQQFQQQQLTKLGLAPAQMELAAFKAFVSSDQRAWTPLLREAGVQSK